MKIGDIVIDRHVEEGFVNLNPEFWSDPDISPLARADMLKDISGLLNQEYERAIEEWEEYAEETAKILKSEKKESK